MSETKCPLGEDCDMTLAWMMGAGRAKDTIKAQAGEITRLRAENEKLLAENANLLAANRDLKDWWDDLRPDHKRLQAEIEKLRAALEKINVGEGWAAQIARAALGEKA